jgi:hypothetical protein
MSVRTSCGGITARQRMQFHFSSSIKSRYQIWIKCDKRQMTSCVHKMCKRTYGQTNMKRAYLLPKLTIRTWYLGWPWSEHAHIIPISRMVDFCRSHSPFHVCLTICPFAYLVYATSHLSFVAFYSYLIFWLAMIWACTYYTDFWYENETARVVVLWYPTRST